jgi:hypothetical protein
MPSRFRSRILFLWLLVPCAVAQDWRGFHGLELQGVAPRAADTGHWTSPIQTHWQVAIPGQGFSSPVVLGDRAYLTTAYETDRGATIREFTTILSYALAWLLLVLALLGGVRISTAQASKPIVIAAALVMTAALFLVAVAAFGGDLFALKNSILRSWKIGVVASFAGVVAAWLATNRTRAAALAFALTATLLGILAFVGMPDRNTFLDFSSSGGVINTALVLGPALAAWTVFLIALLPEATVARFFNHSAQWNQSRVVKALVVFGLPAFLTGAALAVLVARVLRAGSAQRSLVPEFGWPLFWGLCLAALLALLQARRFVSQLPTMRRALQWSAVPVAAALAATFFLRFAAFPSQREIAHAVASVSKRTGELDWVRDIAFSSRLHDFKGVNSRATPTLAAGPQGLAAFFGPVGLYGLSLDGNVRWQSESAGFDTEFGVGHSPAATDGVVVLANEHASAGQSHISAYDMAGGQLLWRRERRTESRSAGYSTPVIRDISGRKVVLMRGWEDLAAYDLHSGKLVWTFPLKHRGNHLVASVVVDDKRAYVLDSTRALALDLQKLARQHDPIAWLVPVPGEKAASPVIIDELLFVATETGLAVCIDAANGKVLWREKLGKRFFASVVAHGNVIIFADETGQLSFVKKGPTFELIASVKLNENVYATPAPQANGLLVRGVTNLFYLRPG